MEINMRTISYKNLLFVDAFFSLDCNLLDFFFLLDFIPINSPFFLVKTVYDSLKTAWRKPE